MRWHYYELMQQEFLLSPIVRDGVNKQTRHAFGLKQRTMPPCTGSHEIYT